MQEHQKHVERSETSGSFQWRNEGRLSWAETWTHPIDRKWEVFVISMETVAYDGERINDYFIYMILQT